MSAPATPLARYPLAAQLGELPVWCARTQRLWFVDIRAPALYALDPEAGRLETFPMPGLTGMAALAESGLVLGVGGSVHRFDPTEGKLGARLFELDADRPGNRVNDTKAGPDGALWCGTMQDGGAEPAGRLYRLTSDGNVTTLLENIFVPNAIAFSPDGGTLYFTDTRKGDILRADVDPERLEFRPFAAVDVAPGRPDGATIDAEGCLWCTRTGGSQVIRLDPEGRVAATLHLPVSQPTACAFGGPDLKTFYVVTARQRLSPEQLAAEPQAGDVFAFDVGVAGIPEPRFAG